ncbi:hypothetical protein ACJRO7_026772 [Eucalyptus globulus]|uniref:Splicing factor subunit n=1 Tax=Eucalyptus globulus TaxID=34317 RepID=A0ABD3JU13_EUCGL
MQTSDRFNINSQLEHLQAKYVGTGHADLNRFEWAVNIQRDSDSTEKHIFRRTSPTSHSVKIVVVPSLPPFLVDFKTAERALCNLLRPFCRSSAFHHTTPPPSSSYRVS